MTNYREHFKQLLPVIQAWTEGKTIQVKYKNDPKDPWVDFITTREPELNNLEWEWRVKPEKKVLYLNIDADGSNWSSESRHEADLGKNHDRVACICVEYEEGQYDA